MNTLINWGMGAYLFAAAPGVDGDQNIWLQWGLAGVVVAYTLYRDWDREKRMRADDQEQQKWIRETLLGELKRSSTAIEMLTKLEQKREAKDVS